MIKSTLPASPIFLIRLRSSGSILVYQAVAGEMPAVDCLAAPTLLPSPRITLGSEMQKNL